MVRRLGDAVPSGQPPAVGQLVQALIDAAVDGKALVAVEEGAAAGERGVVVRGPAVAREGALPAEALCPAHIRALCEGRLAVERAAPEAALLGGGAGLSGAGGAAEAGAGGHLEAVGVARVWTLEE